MSRHLLRHVHARRLFATVLVGAGLLLCACGSTATEPPSPSDAGNELDGGPSDAGPSDAGPADAGPSDAGVAMPIKYLVVLIKENHTFDNYFAGFPGATTSLTAKLSTGKTITRPVAPSTTLPRDICHTHTCATTAYRKGAMTGFDLVPGAEADAGGGTTDDLAFIHYTEQQIPNYWQYARNFVLADHFFSNTFANSFPGHFASANGFALATSNPTCPADAGDGDGCLSNCTVQQYDPRTCAIQSGPACWDAPSWVQELPAGVTWAEYGWSTMLSVKKVSQLPNVASHFKGQSALLPDLQSGNFANIVFAHIEGGASEHPPQAVCPGENYSVQLINAIMNGPHWAETAILLTWDDWGGFYDSVAPPAQACSNGDYFHPGFRLPMIVISPYAKKGFVLKTPTEQASIVRLIEDIWGLPRLAAQDPRLRDAQAGSLLDAFDFGQAPREPMPLQTRTCP